METILIVDDEEKIRELYGRVISRAGFNVLLAPNAAVANELLTHARVHLVLLDINMAGVDGVDLSEIIHAFHSDVKVIVSSVYPLDEQKQRVQHANDFFDKSEGLGVLLAKVGQHMRSPGGRKCVLIIDEDMHTRVLFTRMLQKEGLETVSFASREKALQFIDETGKRVDVFILVTRAMVNRKHSFFELISARQPQAKVLVVGSDAVHWQGSPDSSAGFASLALEDLLSKARKLASLRN
jgi:DNA-binding NtrC family response regulator